MKWDCHSDSLHKNIAIHFLIIILKSLQDKTLI